MSKKKITQNDLRKVMHEYKKSTSIKRIDSPLIKYTDSGQLMCILCQSIIRSETAWPIHIVSAKHKQNVEYAKKTKLETVSVSKRPSSPIKEVSQKKCKIQNPINCQEVKGVPADFFDKAVTTPTVPVKKHENEIRYMNELANKTKIDKHEEIKKNNDNCLPEGFFDDPVLDAKVRNVEYKNPMDDEWERFQREIKEEAAQSAQIIADDQEEATAERQLEEIDEQIHNWSRVMDLVKLKESVQREDKKHDVSMDDTSSDDEFQYDEEMDWRAKKSVK